MQRSGLTHSPVPAPECPTVCFTLFPNHIEHLGHTFFRADDTFDFPVKIDIGHVTTRQL